MLEAFTKKHTFYFKQPGGTSRGVLKSKDSWFIFVYNIDEPQIKGIGECSIIQGLSIDERPDFEQKLNQVCNDINNYKYWLDEGLVGFPSIRFGVEMAIKDLFAGGTKLLFPSLFTEGKGEISINGLVWMGDFEEMRKRIIHKIESGYSCVKVKIGAINFEDELRLLKLIRNDFTEKDIELRLDANGAFSYEEALDKISRLSEFAIHSIEQPIKQQQWKNMADLCNKSSIPIALDEELIGVCHIEDIRQMLDVIKPHFIILKPSFLGGWKQSHIFIEEAENRNIGWWVTSALESNIGLNAIAQWTYTLQNNIPQGLGTGQVFSNNIHSPLTILNSSLNYNPLIGWDLTELINV
ncbi:MAG: o-succinylbenzoate synthase [Bacteroidetes bacterium]|jgi:o-succinylbenzoate synthase|nr:o-succinylbenzoate synthase [Bacteroidota bacterium]|tara:strand:- start:1189 stop:2247 length:1059 start_codon:yes stop_codon:yes gene_type:complete